MFTNDLFLFGEASFSIMEKIKKILNLYGSFSGQLVNFSKSSIFFSKNLSYSAQLDLTQVLGVCLVQADSQYLGGPLIQGCSQKLLKKNLVERMDKKLYAWKARLLSHARRETLIKASPMFIPLYLMGLGLLNGNMINTLEGRMRNFYWGFNFHSDIYFFGHGTSCSFQRTKVA